jgi:hypothetical protein
MKLFTTHTQGGLKMRREKMNLIILTVLMATVLFTISADAAAKWYTCTINSIGNYGATSYINLTDIGGKFTNLPFIPYAGQENRQLATALTALSNDMEVAVLVDYTLAQASRKLNAFYIMAP